MEDHGLGELTELLDDLLTASRFWCLGSGVDLAKVEAIRHRGLVLAHRRYAAAIPVYRRLAEESGLLEADSVAEIAGELMLTGEVFKSYRPEWLAAADFARLTEWLGGICTQRPAVDLDGVRDVRSWRQRLRTGGIFLSTSSGTSGRSSFIPRDAATWAALCGNGAAYTPAVFAERPVAYADFDCLVLGFPGHGTGIQGGGTGLARVAARSCFLFTEELDEDRARHLAAGGAMELAGTEHGLDAAYDRAFAFLRGAMAGGRPVLLFGAPFQVDQACRRARAESPALTLPPHSIAVTGGGWKSFSGEKVDRDDLHERLREAFGIPASHVIDTYSTSEINAVLMTCPHGRYHIPPLLEAVVLDDLLLPLAGEEAEGALGFLDPFALSYPGFVITGDQARLVRSPCPCGLTGPALAGEIRRRSAAEVKGCGGVMATVRSG